MNLREEKKWKILFEPTTKRTETGVGKINSSSTTGYSYYRHEPGNCDCEKIFDKASREI